MFLLRAMGAPPAVVLGCPQGSAEHAALLAAISSPTEDDIIGAILRARGQWDPPWRREWKGGRELAQVRRERAQRRTARRALRAKLRAAGLTGAAAQACALSRRPRRR
jgi:hypothetical protein